MAREFVVACAPSSSQTSAILARASTPDMCREDADLVACSGSTMSAVADRLGVTKQAPARCVSSRLRGDLDAAGPSSTQVYDLAPLLGAHPGGDEMLLTRAGTDATKEFEVFEHSEKARVRRDQDARPSHLAPHRLPAWGGPTNPASECTRPAFAVQVSRLPATHRRKSSRTSKKGQIADVGEACRLCGSAESVRSSCLRCCWKQPRGLRSKVKLGVGALHGSEASSGRSLDARTPHGHIGGSSANGAAASQPADPKCGAS